MGKAYRRSDEVHYLRLYQATKIAADLEQIGFQTQLSHSYGSYQLPPAHTAFIAQKPR